MGLTSAAVLAGGDSKRMGSNKALLKINNETLIELIVGKLNPLFKETIIVTHLKEEFVRLELGAVKYIEDQPVGIIKSALRGIYSALKVSSSSKTFVVACDMPFINPLLINYMAKFTDDFDVVIPKIGKHYQPLHGFYGKNCIPIAEEMLTAESFKISQLYERVKVKTINEDDLRMLGLNEILFLNVNNGEDYDKALRIYQSSNLFKGDAFNAST